MLKSIHHIAVICTDINASKAFYVDKLGLTLLSEHFRADRLSWKCDLALHGKYVLELFSFPDPPMRQSRPEAAGLRHLAFEVVNVWEEKARLEALGVTVEPIRMDEYTGKSFTFLTDPDNLPIELYQT